MAESIAWSPPELGGHSLKIMATLGDGAFATVYHVEVLLLTCRFEWLAGTVQQQQEKITAAPFSCPVRMPGHLHGGGFCAEAGSASERPSGRGGGGGHHHAATAA